MINSVLLEGDLTKQRLKRALKEIKVVSDYLRNNPDEESLVLVISSEGGDGVAAVSFVEGVLKCTEGLDIEVKIYQAKSAAAYIFLALFEYITYAEMDSTQELAFHRGEVRLDPTQISSDNKIDDQLARAIRRYQSALYEAMLDKDLFFEGQSSINGFLAKGWHKVSAADCVKLKLVQNLF